MKITQQVYRDLQWKLWILLHKSAPNQKLLCCNIIIYSIMFYYQNLLSYNIQYHCVAHQASHQLHLNLDDNIFIIYGHILFFKCTYLYGISVILQSAKIRVLSFWSLMTADHAVVVVNTPSICLPNSLPLKSRYSRFDRATTLQLTKTQFSVVCISAGLI